MSIQIKAQNKFWHTWREAVLAGFAAAAASPDSPLLPAANMPLPVISFHLGAEHGFLEKGVIRSQSQINRARARRRAREGGGEFGGAVVGTEEQSDLLVRLSASSSVTWPPKTTFLIASDGCAQGKAIKRGELTSQSVAARHGEEMRCGSSWREGGSEEGGGVTWPGRRGGDGVAGAVAWPWGCGHASRSAVEVWELLTGAALSISSSSSSRSASPFSL
jgi:hypothetical protein